MTTVTITEALAEIKTIGKRLQQKQQFIAQNIGRPSVVLDGLSKDGGSEKLVSEAMQAHGDLVKRIEDIRVAIQAANQRNTLTIEGLSKSVAGWLAWRKECAPHQKAVLQSMSAQIKSGHDQMRGKGTAEAPISFITHFSEQEIARRLELIEKILGDLDGKLSLFNATCTVEIG